MLLAGKNAVVFGAGGDIGGGVGREFAREGAALFLSGRRLDKVQKAALEIEAEGGKAEAEQVDALDEQAVNSYLNDLAQQIGKIDIVFNATGPQPIEYDNGRATVEIDAKKFLLPINTYTASNFLTARAAARHMLPQKSGVILFVTADPSQGVGQFAAIGMAMGAIESMLRCFADEWGPSGIRVVGIRSRGMIDTRTIQQTFELVGQRTGQSPGDIESGATRGTRLKYLPIVSDTAKIAAFVASDRARSITGAIINATSGSLLD